MNCKNCEKQFTPLKKSKGLFCSNPCHDQWRRNQADSVSWRNEAIRLHKEGFGAARTAAKLGVKKSAVLTLLKRTGNHDPAFAKESETKRRLGMGPGGRPKAFNIEKLQREAFFKEQCTFLGDELNHWRSHPMAAAWKAANSYWNNPAVMARQKQNAKNRHNRNKTSAEYATRRRLGTILWKSRNPELVKKNQRKHSKAFKLRNPDKVRAYRQRRNKRPEYKLLNNLRRRLRGIIKQRTNRIRTSELTGCTTIELKDHIEKQFVSGMGWHNRHEWDADHIVPCAAFKLEDKEQQRLCFHYSNLRPLWKHLNQAKGALIMPTIERAANAVC